MKKSNTKFQLAPLKLLTNFEFLLETSSKTLKRQFCLWKCLLEADCEIIPEAACDKLFLAHFTSANERSVLENIDQSHRREYWVGFQKAFSKSSNFKEANTKLILDKVVKSFLKTLKTISEYTKSTD